MPCGTFASQRAARGQSDYDGDETLRLAAEAIMHKIGEAVARLPPEFTADHPDVRWRSMKATRNLVAHRYEQVDYRILWNALIHRLPEEMTVIAHLLGEGGSGAGTA